MAILKKLSWMVWEGLRDIFGHVWARFGPFSPSKSLTLGPISAVNYYMHVCGLSKSRSRRGK